MHTHIHFVHYYFDSLVCSGCSLNGDSLVLVTAGARCESHICIQHNAIAHSHPHTEWKTVRDTHTLTCQLKMRQQQIKLYEYCCQRPTAHERTNDGIHAIIELNKQAFLRLILYACRVRWVCCCFFPLLLLRFWFVQFDAWLVHGHTAWRIVFVCAWTYLS